MAVHVPVARIESLWSPFRGRLWSCRAVRMREVAVALEKRAFKKTPWSPKWTAQEHAQRIAWLVAHGWADAIQIDVGVPGYLTYLPHDLVTDGNHRLAAAIFRKDETILADVSGSFEYALELFGVDIVDV